jgi:hypothetical protein
MWCPEGYLLFFEIKRQINQLVYSAFEPTTAKRSSSEQERKMRLNDFAWSSFFEECPSLSVCSPSGTLLRISHEIGLQLREPVLSGPRNGLWVFIDDESGVVQTGQVKGRAERAEECLAAHFRGLNTDDFAYPESLNEYQWSCLGLATEAKNTVGLFANFEGWAICCRKEDGPVSGLTDFIELWSERDFSNWDSLTADAKPEIGWEEGQTKMGRKPKVPAVSKAYRRRFPEGHGNLALKVVLRNLIDDTGFGFGMDTLKRAIKAADH